MIFFFITRVNISCSWRSSSLLPRSSVLCSSVSEKCSMHLIDSFSCSVMITSYITQRQKPIDFLFPMISHIHVQVRKMHNILMKETTDFSIFSIHGISGAKVTRLDCLWASSSRQTKRKYLDGCVVVKSKWFGLSILQVHLQDIWHEKQRVVFHSVLHGTRELLYYCTSRDFTDISCFLEPEHELHSHKNIQYIN